MLAGPVPAFILPWIAHYGIAAIFVLLLLGVFGLPVPDETLLTFAGVLVRQAQLHFLPTVIAAPIAEATGRAVAMTPVLSGRRRIVRRNLQREHVKRIAAVLTKASASAPADARALQRENARALIAQLKVAQGRPGLSQEARAHVADSLNTLEEAMRAPMQRMS